MRPAILTALLVGLCAAGMAAPLNQEIPFYPDAFDIASMPQSDESMPSVVSDAPLSVEADYAERLLVTESSSRLDLESTAADDVDNVGSTRVPEPDNIFLLLAGCGVIAAFTIYRLNYVEPRRRHRRSMRALTVLR